ncbi:nuclear envelope phosphatase-regulatory subunit 1-like isoform X1 [Photinus pyralis]|uniref:nuclear envelope phosphatase-regulatory subunit 1-like isoform X1 n=1 Tax=Photinus pyralis TaxID=7054 RepID=UPI0012677302|nr:nuclear envelope phosphatase-regulatory subunit 1-like isoform X1 [Photinus pyralis]
MSLEPTACEGKQYETKKTMVITYKLDVIVDLKAFERRLTEVIACLQPSTTRWRIVLIIVSVCVAAGAGQWLTDPYTRIIPLSQSLSNHPFFIIATLLLVIIFLLGVHKRVIAASIITTRTREVLCDFNMSCDDTGKLILKPRPTNVT